MKYTGEKEKMSKQQPRSYLESSVAHQCSNPLVICEIFFRNNRPIIMKQCQVIHKSILDIMVKNEFHRSNSLIVISKALNLS